LKAAHGLLQMVCSDLSMQRCTSAFACDACPSSMGVVVATRGVKDAASVAAHCERSRFKLNFGLAPRRREVGLEGLQSLLDPNTSVGTGDLRHESWEEDPKFPDVPEVLMKSGTCRGVYSGRLHRFEPFHFKEARSGL
jgi:hypothetical protein